MLLDMPASKKYIRSTASSGHSVEGDGVGDTFKREEDMGGANLGNVVPFCPATGDTKKSIQRTIIVKQYFETAVLRLCACVSDSVASNFHVDGARFEKYFPFHDV